MHMQKLLDPRQEIYRLDIAHQKYKHSNIEGAEKYISSYIVGQASAGGEAAQLARQASDTFGVPVLPFAGVAAPLGGMSPRPHSVRCLQYENEQSALCLLAACSGALKLPVTLQIQPTDLPSASCPFPCRLGCHVM